MKRQKTHETPRRVLRMRQLRREREMTQTDLAQRVELSPAAISDIENGRSKPSLEKAIAIANVFGRSVEEVFGYVELTA